jgi:hypothetical protein
MDVRLVTSHQYTVPRVREVAPQAHLPSPSVDETRRALSQRDLVAASLIACPGRYGAAAKP